MISHLHFGKITHSNTQPDIWLLREESAHSFNFGSAKPYMTFHLKTTRN